MKIYQLPFIFALLCIVACHHKETTSETTTADESEQVQTPVTITSVSIEPMEEYIELNATSSFLQSSLVKSNINGYIKSVNTKVGEFAGAGKTLFTLKTKEAESLGNTINKLDPDFHFSGSVSIHASQSGYVTQLDHQAGD